MNQTPQTIQTPAARRFQRWLKQWLPIVAFVFMCASCLWLSQFQGQKIVLTGEIEAPELVIASPQAGIIKQLLPDLNENTDPVYSNITQGQLILRLDDSSVQQSLDDLQNELLSLARSVEVELARIDMDPDSREVPVSTESTSDLSPQSTNTDNTQKLANELQAWRLGATTIESQLKQVELTRLRLQLRNVDFQQANLTRETQKNSATDAGSGTSGLQKQKNELELAVAKLNTDLAFDGSAQSGAKLLSSVDESELSVAGRSLFRSMRRRCELMQSRLAATMKSADMLDITSPVDGQIDKTHVRPLQLLEPGTPIISIVPNRNTYAIGYAREHSAVRPVAGMPVAIRSLSDPSHRFESTIEAVGPKIESIPARHRANPRIEEWGRPVRISIPNEMAVEPGSAISIELILGRTLN